MSFEGFAGFLENRRTIASLEGMVAGGRLPHAICLEGEDGTGKRTLARLVAAAALCEGEGPRPCGQCRHCAKAARDIHPDLITLSGGKGSRSFHIDAIRALRQQAYLSPNEGRVKVFLLADAHTMTIQAQNALLKLIEEPPDVAMFLLTCRSRHLLLPTILSRVTCLSLEAPSVEGCLEALERLAPKATAQERQAAAQAAGGNIGEALLILGGEEKDPPGAQALALLQLLSRGDEYGALVRLVPYEKDRPGLERLLERLLDAVRRAAVCRDPAQRLVTPAQAGRLEAVVSRAAAMTVQNVSVALVAAVLCAEATAAL